MTPCARAALQLAQAIGYCRLFGVEIGELDGVLPADVAIAACRELADRVAAWTEQLQELPERYFGAIDGFEAEAASDDVLIACMDSWATTAAIEEAYTRCGPEDDVDTFSAELDRLGDALDEFDRKAREHADLLSTLAKTNLLSNWRSYLVEPWSELLPWWLDGTLERTAEAVDQLVAATVPGESDRRAEKARDRSQITGPSPPCARDGRCRSFGSRQNLFLGFSRWTVPGIAHADHDLAGDGSARVCAPRERSTDRRTQGPQGPTRRFAAGAHRRQGPRRVRHRVGSWAAVATASR